MALAKRRSFFGIRGRHVLGLVVLGLGIYGQTVFFPFVHDDIVFIRLNPAIGLWNDLPGIFLFPRQALPGSAIVNTYYRPLLEVYYRLVHAAFGMSPAVYHALNVLFHFLNGLWVYKICGRLLSRPGWAFFAAAVFLTHPVQTEAVACVAGVSNLLLTFLLLAGFYGFLRWRTGSSGVLAGGVLGLYLAALFVKEQAVVFPLLLLAYDVGFHVKGRPFFGRKQILPAGVWLMTMCYVLARGALAGGLVPELGTMDETLLRWAAIPNIFMTQLRLCFWPAGLHYYRSADILAPAWPGLAGLAVVVGLAAGARCWAVRRGLAAEARVAVFGGVWFLAALLPTLNIVPLVHEFSFVAVFEHFLYLPLPGLIFLTLAAAEAGAKTVSSIKRPLKVIGPAVVVLLCGVSLSQARVWRHEVPLFEQAAVYEGRLARVRLLLAKAYYFSGDYQKAEQQFRHARRITLGYLSKVAAPRARVFYLGLLKGLYFDLAHCYEATGQWEQAKGCYLQALEIDPGDPVVLNNLGAVLLNMGDYAAAAGAFRASLERAPRDLGAKTNLAVCLVHSGQSGQARKLWEEVLEVDPEYGPARKNLRVLRFQAGPQ